MEIGCIATEPGSTRLYKTGTWRSQRPTYRFERCFKCGMCQIFCPEACVFVNQQGFFEADMDYCKGCGICAKECWTKVITMVEEEE
ncbi:MAG: pyruvate ferredoxin oxidoreductase [Chloroflexi bacterium]|nr:pyruvate ferredoxin oxidoreductase [Chloroflexota bacterium]